MNKIKKVRVFICLRRYLNHSSLDVNAITKEIVYEDIIFLNISYFFAPFSKLILLPSTQI